MPEFRTAYGPKPRVTLDCGEGLTKQSMRDECDINLIMKKYAKTGVLEHQRQYRGDYSEFEAIDFHEAMNAITAANAMFMELPAKVRAQFGNDPGSFVDFVTDPENLEAVQKMGLAPASNAPPPKGVKPAPEPPSEPPPAAEAPPEAPPE